VSSGLSAQFRVGAFNISSPVVSYVSHKELQTVVPPFPDLLKTTKGLLFLGSNNMPIHFCADVGTTDQYMHIPQFTIQGPNMELFVSDLRNHRVHKVDYTTGMTDTFEEHSGGLKTPAGLGVGPDGALYVSSSGTNTILRYDTHTLHFLGRWATVPGEPRGIIWKGHELFVVSHLKNRVLRFKHHNGTVNWRIDERGRQGTFAGYFTQDMSGLYPHNAGGSLPVSDSLSTRDRLDHPDDLMFHAVDGELKLFVTSSHSNAIIQFNGVTGAFERVFNDVPIKMASALAFAYRGFNRDMFATSPYAGIAFARFDGANGRFKRKFNDITLRRPKGLLILGDMIMVSDREAVRAYDLDSGTPLQAAAALNGARLGMLTWNMQCYSDDAVEVGNKYSNWDRVYSGDMGNPADADATGVGTTQPSSCAQNHTCSWDDHKTDYGAEDPVKPHRTDASTPHKDYPGLGNSFHQGPGAG